MSRAAAQRTWIAVVGARPNFVKLLPLLRAFPREGLELTWIHTGQHRAPALDRKMRSDLRLPPPRRRLSTRPPGPTRVPALTRALRPVLRAAQAGVLVVGDVDSTLAGARAAKDLDLPLVHVEAGLRSGDRTQPEERNRIEVDRLSDRLYLSEPQARRHLRAEGLAGRPQPVVGNVMADALRLVAARIPALAEVLPDGLRPREHLLATLHRPENVDRPRRLRAWLAALGEAGRETPVLLPLHPRTRRRIRGLATPPGVHLLPPLSYLAFLAVARTARAILTDSGGLQVEAAALRVPCLTLRARSEHESTLASGANRLVPRPEQLGGMLAGLRAAAPPLRGASRLLDGRAALRIARDLARNAPPSGAADADEA